MKTYVLLYIENGQNRAWRFEAENFFLANVKALAYIMFSNKKWVDLIEEE